MVGYVFLDVLIGIVPIVGDLFDVAYKSNTKILQMIETHIAQHGDATVNPASQLNVPKFLKTRLSAKPWRQE